MSRFESKNKWSRYTIRTNRLRGGQDFLPSDKEMKKKRRGFSAQVVWNRHKLAQETVE